MGGSQRLANETIDEKENAVFPTSSPGGALRDLRREITPGEEY